MVDHEKRGRPLKNIVTMVIHGHYFAWEGTQEWFETAMVNSSHRSSTVLRSVLSPGIAGSAKTCTTRLLLRVVLQLFRVGLYSAEYLGPISR